MQSEEEIVTNVEGTPVEVENTAEVAEETPVEVVDEEVLGEATE